MNDLIELIEVESGSFFMGSPESENNRYEAEGPQHLVTVPSFLMGKYLVTQAQWKFVAALPKVEKDLYPNPSHFQGDNHPVEQVSWYDATEFCNRLAQHTDRPYRLPTEAEWEFACRAGTTTPYSVGEMLTKEQAKFFANGTSDVGSFQANDFGLYDMHGNVYEWCQDHWHHNYDGAPTDGSVWLTNNEKTGRVMRGGSWFSLPRYCRSASRYNDTPDVRDNLIGFRVVCDC